MFFLMGALFMTKQALEKHAFYLKYFDGDNRPRYPSNRMAIIPFVI